VLKRDVKHLLTLPPFTMGAGNWSQILKLGPNI